MSRVSAAQKAPAIESSRQFCPVDKSVDDTLTEVAQLVLWPDNTAPHLAAAIEGIGGRCSIRQAERYIGGQCEWTGPAVAAVISEILKRRRVRHVRVRSR